MNTPFRYDFVGSFLRPETLKRARRDFEEGKISKEELTKIEDAAILDLVEKQKKAGYHVITDGEFRRATWHLDFMWGFNGVGHEPTKTGLPFHGEAAMLDDTYLTGKISVDQHPFVEHFKFVKALEDENTVAKQTIPAPAQFLEQFIMPMSLPNTNQYYPDVEELAEEGYAVGKVDVDQNMALAQQFRVVSIPTLILFKDGAEVKRFVGLTSKEELKSALEG